jgi:phosphocarrier protein FPr
MPICLADTRYLTLTEERRMIHLTKDVIQLRARAQSKEEAIRQAGRLLAEGGYIDPGYIKSMLGREQQANTYLGNGIAIPHGMQQDRELIQRTGVSVVQIPDGVTWNAGETVHLVVGIAAKSDEHLQILANLTDVLDDPQTVQRLAHTDDPQQIIQSLSGARDGGSAPAPPAEDLSGAKSVDVQVAGSAGLHARPATFFVDVASQFESDVRVQHNGKTANGKAMASLLRLGVESGNTIRIIARGPDEDAALQALREAVESGLGEGEAEGLPHRDDTTPAQCLSINCSTERE